MISSLTRKLRRSEIDILKAKSCCDSLVLHKGLQGHEDVGLFYETKYGTQAIVRFL